eukprot:scaffold130808_cov63-Phaeocystis_antarctica.AAC.4
MSLKTAVAWPGDSWLAAPGELAHALATCAVAMAWTSLLRGACCGAAANSAAAVPPAGGEVATVIEPGWKGESSVPSPSSGTSHTLTTLVRLGPLPALGVRRRLLVRHLHLQLQVTQLHRAQAVCDLEPFDVHKRLALSELDPPYLAHTPACEEGRLQLAYPRQGVRQACHAEPHEVRYGRDRWRHTRHRVGRQERTRLVHRRTAARCHTVVELRRVDHAVRRPSQRARGEHLMREHRR